MVFRTLGLILVEVLHLILVIVELLTTRLWKCQCVRVHDCHGGTAVDATLHCTE